MKGYAKLLVLLLAIGAISQAVLSHADGFNQPPSKDEQLRRYKALEARLQTFLESERFGYQAQELSKDQYMKNQLEGLLNDLEAVMATTERTEPGP